ncbi:hypothetical protein GCM10011410_07210 [Hoyosella rhizosphaerae]|uniref:Uncharacterized protein n=1 Tax=Hoyosella rhizosphaerae TaxID=1755582 RepID=A0A916U1I2_9ACTN|nr:hypothetical protein GCM10011410_07210 [Hoyosella rhizosphaerae]
MLGPVVLCPRDGVKGECVVGAHRLILSLILEVLVHGRDRKHLDVLLLDYHVLCN